MHHQPRHAAPLRTVVPLLAACIAAGCARTVVVDPLEVPAGSTDANAQLDFWHALPERSAVTNDEAFHALLLFTDGDDPNAAYADRVADLKARGWLDAGFDEPADQTMARGTLAAALARHLGIEGGVFMRLTNASPRYATRELTYLGVMSPGSDQRVMSGPEFIGVISKAQDYALLRDTPRRGESR